MFKSKFLKGSSFVAASTSLVSGAQCQSCSADAYIEAENEIGGKFYLPVNEEQAKELLNCFCEAGLLSKKDLEEAYKKLNSK